jgi:hypothetical protein
VYRNRGLWAIAMAASSVGRSIGKAKESLENRREAGFKNEKNGEMKRFETTPSHGGSKNPEKG